MTGIDYAVSDRIAAHGVTRPNASAVVTIYRRIVRHPLHYAAGEAPVDLSAAVTALLIRPR